MKIHINLKKINNQLKILYPMDIHKNKISHQNKNLKLSLLIIIRR